MAIVFDTYRFEGPFTSLRELKESPGVFIVLCTMGNGCTFIVDVSEADNVRLCVQNSNNKDCWRGNCKGTLSIAVLYTPELDRQGRKDIENIIRARDFVPCK